jgi:4-diphosphocytidyl-2-C-methyl-D-erythritol kinase
LNIALPARAKLNLDLQVVARRDDGFHELRTTYQAIDLHDMLIMSRAKETTLTTSGLPVNTISENLVIKAHRALETATQQSLPTHMHLHKRIPPGSGMGGASSDAAAALRGLAAIHELDADLNEIAHTIGADVAFFLHGGAAIGEGAGERLTRIEVVEGWFAIAWPDIELSTADVYRAWDEVKGEGPNHLRRAAEEVEPALKEFASTLGAKEHWQMTGSGSAFFRRCESHAEAKQAIEHLKCWTAVSRPVGPW